MIDITYEALPSDTRYSHIRLFQLVLSREHTHNNWLYSIPILGFFK